MYRLECETPRCDAIIKAVRAIEADLPTTATYHRMRLAFRTHCPPDIDGRDERRVWRDEVRRVLDRRFPDVAKKRRGSALQRHEARLRARMHYAAMPGLLLHSPETARNEVPAAGATVVR